MEDEITRLVAGGLNPTNVTFSNEFIEQNKHRMPPHALVALITSSEGLHFTDPITSSVYTVVDAWVQSDEVSVVVKGTRQ